MEVLISNRKMVFVIPVIVSVWYTYIGVALSEGPATTVHTLGFAWSAACTRVGSVAVVSPFQDNSNDKGLT